MRGFVPPRPLFTCSWKVLLGWSLTPTHPSPSSPSPLVTEHEQLPEAVVTPWAPWRGRRRCCRRCCWLLIPSPFPKLASNRAHPTPGWLRSRCPIIRKIPPNPRAAEGGGREGEPRRSPAPCRGHCSVCSPLRRLVRS